jgi:hypothetical protein
MADKINNYTVSEADNGNLVVQSPAIGTREVAAPEGDYLTINGAWYLDSLPSSIVIERADGSLGMISITPFRAITPQDIRDYKGYHPRKCKGSPLPDYLYRFYGLAKNTESATEVIHIRLTPTEKAKIDDAAKNAELTTSEYVRNWVRSL